MISDSPFICKKWKKWSPEERTNLYTVPLGENLDEVVTFVSQHGCGNHIIAEAFSMVID